MSIYFLHTRKQGNGRRLLSDHVVASCQIMLSDRACTIPRYRTTAYIASRHFGHVRATTTSWWRITHLLHSNIFLKLRSSNWIATLIMVVFLGGMINVHWELRSTILLLDCRTESAVWNLNRGQESRPIRDYSDNIFKTLFARLFELFFPALYTAFEERESLLAFTFLCLCYLRMVSIRIQ